jgi:hypothetical protein
MKDAEIAMRQRVALGIKRRKLAEEVGNGRPPPQGSAARAEWLKRAREEAKARRIDAVFTKHGLG